MKNPPSVGDFLFTEVLEPLGLNVERAAERMHVDAKVLKALVDEETPLTLEMAHAIESAFGGPRADHLMRMQEAYDTAQAAR